MSKSDSRAKSRWADPRTLGAGFLALTALASLVLLVMFVMRGPRIGQPGAMGEIEAPDLGSLASVGSEPRVLASRDLQIQVTDKDDPTRLLAEMHFAKLDPLANHRYEAEGTATWVFLKTGDLLLVTAPRATLRMPDGKRPESGRLMGGVVLRVYDTPKGGGRPDPDFSTPKLTAKTERFSFDLTMGEISAPGRLTVHTDRVDFAGSDMFAILNESQRRIEKIEIGEGESLVYRAELSDDSERGASIASVNGREQGGVSNPTIPTGSEDSDGELDHAANSRIPPRADRSKPPLRQHYLVRFSENIRVVQGLKEIRSDELEVWARMVDGKLPDDALGREIRRGDALVPDETRGVQLAGGALSGLFGATALGVTQEIQAVSKPDRLGGFGVVLAQPPEDLAGNQEAELLLESAGEDSAVVLRWDGAMTVDFLGGGAPAELKNQNHVAVRFTSPTSGTVAFEDRESGSSGLCGVLEYKATVREVVLSGLGPHAVRLARPGSGMLEAGRVELDLDSGLARIPGAGIAQALHEDQDQPDPSHQRRVSWTGRADLRLALRGDRMNGDLEQAELFGRVEAIDGDARLNGEVMDATFFERRDDRRATLRHLSVTGPVTGGDGRGATLLGERLSVDFVPSEDGRRSDPRTVSIEGSAEARRDSTTLTGEIIDARLERNSDEKLIVAFVSARNNVRYSDTKNAILATSDRLRADATLKIADLEGEHVSLRQGNDEITGKQVHLNGTDRIVEAFGAGTFTRFAETEDAPPIATASWTKEMAFDDRQGTLDCYGDAFAQWRPEALAIDDVTAERLHIELTPYREQSEGADPLGVRPTDDRREVIRVRAIGGSLLEQGGALAVIQSVRESPVEPGEGEQRAIETLLRLEGPEIVANNQIGELRVDHPGRLVVADYRESKGETGEGSKGIGDGASTDGGAPLNLADPGSMRGSALFEWDGWLVVDRNADTITMDDHVRMTHIRLGDQLATRLLCEHLVAGFEAQDEAQRELGAGRLRSVLARGSVYVRSGRQELMGDELLYDARLSTVEAQADEGGRVTYVDARTGTPSSAGRIFWDLSTDRIEIREPGTLVMPR